MRSGGHQTSPLPCMWKMWEHDWCLTISCGKYTEGQGSGTSWVCPSQLQGPKFQLHLSKDALCSLSAFARSWQRCWIPLDMWEVHKSSRIYFRAAFIKPRREMDPWIPAILKLWRLFLVTEVWPLHFKLGPGLPGLNLNQSVAKLWFSSRVSNGLNPCPAQ